MGETEDAVKIVNMANELRKQIDMTFHGWNSRYAARQLVSIIVNGHPEVGDQHPLSSASLFDDAVEAFVSLMH